MNLATLGEESVRRYGEYVSLAFEGREWTNLEQQGAAHRLAHTLRRRGIGPGDRVVVMLADSEAKLLIISPERSWGSSRGDRARWS